MYWEILLGNRERVNIMLIIFNYGFRFCVFVCGVLLVVKKNCKDIWG